MLGTNVREVGLHDFVVTSVLEGLLCGAVAGFFAAPLAYIVSLRNVGIRRALWPAIGGTVAGGLAGAAVNPFAAVITGLIGFFGGIRWAKSRVNVD
jgi:hypothetical protein